MLPPVPTLALIWLQTFDRVAAHLALAWRYGKVVLRK